MTHTVLVAVTGAAGRIGGRVAHRLAAGIPQRLLVRDTTRAPRLPDVPAVVAPDDDSAAVRSALTGITTVFMVSGSEAPGRLDHHYRFIDAATAAGVDHLIYPSFYGAAPGATFTLAREHWSTEQHIRSSGVTFTFLRDNLYADFLPTMVGMTERFVVLPARERSLRSFKMISTDVVATILRDPIPHMERTYDLTGPEELMLAEIATTITVVIGRIVHYHCETPDEAHTSRAVYRAPPWQVEAWVSTYTAIAAGEMAGTSTAILDIIGRPATSLTEFLSKDTRNPRPHASSQSTHPYAGAAPRRQK